jgi:hypothetical protein
MGPAPATRRRVDTNQHAGTTRSRLLFPTRWSAAAALLVCVVAPAVLVGLQIHATPKFSPIDEVAHFDYVERAARAEIPRQGERLLPTTLRELACRGLYFGTRLPPCTAATLPYERFPGEGSQYEAHQTPTYYVATVPLRWVAVHLLGVGSRLDATRMTNVVWLVAGLLLAWAAGRVLGVDPLALAAALLLLGSAPTVVYENGIVSNDATAVPAGAAVALVAALAYRRGGRHVWLALFGVGFAAAALKASNVLVVVALSAAFAVAAIADRVGAERWTVTARRWLSRGGALVLGGAAATLVWSVAHRLVALIDLHDEPAFAALRASPHTLGVILREATPLMDPLTASYVSPETLGRDTLDPLEAALRFVFAGAALAGLFVSRRRWPHVVGLITLPALFLGGVALGLSLSLTYDMDPVISARHGLSLTPTLAIVLAASVVGRWSRWALAGLAVILFATTLGVLLARL